uniref:MBD domain-containing protein n=1 Tax=Solanum lycopersicum TaxID=4081 RepID=A0A3Q7IGS8_SOLLC
MTKVDAADSFIQPKIDTSDDFINDGIYSDLLLPPGTYIDVELDAREDTITPNKGDVPYEGNLSFVPRSKLKIRRKIAPIHHVNLDRPLWLSQDWKFETKVRTIGATVGRVDKLYIEPIFKSKFRSKLEVEEFLKTGCKRTRKKYCHNHDGAT